MRKLNSVLSKRLVRFMVAEAKKDEAKYLDFFREFGQFIKEGVYADFDNKQETAKLLRFGSSTVGAEELVSLDDYISRMVPEQEEKIYWARGRTTNLPSRFLILSHVRVGLGLG